MAEKLKLKKSVKSKASNKIRRLKLKLNKISDKAQKTTTVKIRKNKIDPIALPGTDTVNANGNLRGMHNAGQSKHMQKVRAMRKFYGPKIPTMQCNTCTISANCPQFKAGYECAFTPFLKSHGIDDEGDLVHYMKELLGANLNRIHLALIMERVTGERPSLEISEQMNSMFEQLAKLTQMERDNDSTEIELETDDKSIIGQLFGGLGSLTSSTEAALVKTSDDNLLLDDKDADVIDVDTLPSDSQSDLIKEFNTQSLN